MLERLTYVEHVVHSLLNKSFGCPFIIAHHSNIGVYIWGCWINIGLS